jgi:DNA-binding MarR family transcriptional regulator
MPATTKSTDYFGTFLTSVSDGSSSSASLSASLQKMLLKWLAEKGEKASLKELVDASPAPPSVLIVMVKQLEDAGLINVVAAENDEYLSLTSLGKTVAA